MDRIPTRPRPQEAAGAHVHAALKDFFATAPPAPAARTPDRLVDLLRARWSRNRRPFSDPAVETQLWEGAVERLRRFCVERDVAASPLLLEHHAEADVAEGVRLFGRVDRVDVDADGTLHIIDYKWGDLPGTVDDAQLRLYAMLLEGRMGRPVRRASYWYLGDGLSWTAHLPPHQHEETARDVVETVGEMLRERAYAPTPGEHCGGCAYRGICPAPRAAGPAVPGGG